VLIGHAHFDHILDGPVLCQQTGARLIGSRATCMVGRAAGLPDAQLVETAGREDIASGAWTLRGLPSVHGKALFGKIPLPGDITAPPPWPARMRDLRHGQVLNWLVDTGGLRVLHVDSADFIRDELQGIKADLVCLCAIGRRYRPGYVREVVALTQPKWIVPCRQPAQARLAGRDRGKLWPKWQAEGDELAQAKADATLLWIKLQEDAGLDIVGDGEQSRQHFVHGFLEQVEGIDFEHKVEMGIRNDRYKAMVPQVVAPLR
jgi:L-ascorbate metabolism protein UlaG (beta-lactamase superfamily)